MTRLTKSIRDNIKNAILRHRFTADVDTLRAKYAALANDVFYDIVPKADQRKLKAAPKGWFPSNSYLRVMFGEHGSGYTRLSFNGELYRFSHTHLGTERKREDITYRLMPWCVFDGVNVKSYPTRHPLTIKFEKLRAEEKKLEEAINTTANQIAAALSSVGTTDLLTKEWPEIKPFVVKYTPTAVSLPTIPTTSLNETLKLPVTEAA